MRVSMFQGDGVLPGELPGRRDNFTNTHKAFGYGLGPMNVLCMT